MTDNTNNNPQHNIPRGPLRRGLGRGLDALFEDSEKRASGQTAPRIAVPVNAANAEVAPDEAPRLVTTASVAPNMAMGARTSAVESPTPKTSGRVRLPIGALEPGLYQPRRVFDDRALDELARSIAQHGILQPLLVRPLSGQTGRYEIIAGERRWRAAQRAQLHDVPVVIEDTITDRAALELGLIENLQREDLNAIDEAAGYQRLIDEFHFTVDKVAEMMGKSRPHVANMVRLLQLPPRVREMVSAGQLSAGHARTLIGAPEPTMLAQHIIDKGLSVRQAEKMIGALLRPKKKAAKGAPKIYTESAHDANLRDLEQVLSLATGLHTKLVMTGPLSGVVQIEFKDLDQLELIQKRLKQPEI